MRIQMGRGINFMKSIKFQMVLHIGTILLTVCVSLGLISYITAAKAMTVQVQETLPQLASQGAKVVSERLNALLGTLEVVANIDRIKDKNNSWEDKNKILQDENKRSGHLYMMMAGIDGAAVMSTGKEANIKDREYFQKAIAGNRAVSEPLVSKVDGSLSIVYAVPIRQEGVIVGILAAVRDGNNLSKITNDIKFGKAGSAFMKDKKGTTIAHTNPEVVMKMDNIFENFKKDPKLEPLVKLEEGMIAGKIGAGAYEYKGEAKFLGYAPVEGTDWSLAVSVPSDEVMGGVQTMRSSVLIASAILLLLGLGVMYFVAGLIATPISSATEHLRVISTGDFTRETPKKYMERKDELGVLAKAIDTMQQSVKDDCCIVSIALASTPNSSFLSMYFFGVSRVKSPVEMTLRCSVAELMGVALNPATKYITPKPSNNNIADAIRTELRMVCTPPITSSLGTDTANDQSVPSTGAYPRNFASPLYSYAPAPIFPAIIPSSNLTKGSSLGSFLKFSKILSIFITTSGLVWAIVVPFLSFMKALPALPNLISLVILLKLLPSLTAAKIPTMTPSCLIGTA